MNWFIYTMCSIQTGYYLLITLSSSNSQPEKLLKSLMLFIYIPRSLVFSQNHWNVSCDVHEYRYNVWLDVDCECVWMWYVLIVVIIPCFAFLFAKQMINGLLHKFAVFVYSRRKGVSSDIFPRFLVQSCPSQAMINAVYLI